MDFENLFDVASILKLSIPVEVFDEWEQNGNKLLAVTDHVGLNDQVTAAMLEAGDFGGEDSAGLVAYAKGTE